jgi:coenzyme F420-reducing hydrogenase alpha subunit
VSTPRTIHVDYLARVEGEGSLTVVFQGSQAKEVRLDIFEPPRFIEGLLRGRDRLEAPDVTARICGICPFSHQLASSLAIERALSLETTTGIRSLRRLIHAGSWIESHVLHAFMLHAPDFHGYPGAIEMSKDHPELVQAALAVKKIGNALCAAVGGREIHPVNLRVGGFWRAPRKDELLPLVPRLAWARDAVLDLVPTLARLPFPSFDRDYELVALSHPDEYPFFEGRLVSSKGLDLDVADYDQHVVEEHVQRSNALHSRLRGGGVPHVGPLARFNLSYEKLSAPAQTAARKARIEPGLANPFKTLLVRAVEVVHCLDEAVRIIEGYQPPPSGFVEVPRRAGHAGWAVEAPRGVLYHAYTLDQAGLITRAKVVAPTSHNMAVMEQDLFAIAPQLAALKHEAATRLAEQAIRNYDPCISCATHFLTLDLRRA